MLRLGRQADRKPQDAFTGILGPWRHHHNTRDSLSVAVAASRLDAGDSFAAGFLWGYLQGDIAKGVAYGTAFSAMRHSIPGDFHWGTLQEVEAMLEGRGLRIQR